MGELKTGMIRVTPVEGIVVEACKEIIETEGRVLPPAEIGENGLKKGMIPVPESLADNARNVAYAEQMMNYLVSGRNVYLSGFIDKNGNRKVASSDDCVKWDLPYKYLETPKKQENIEIDLRNVVGVEPMNNDFQELSLSIIDTKKEEDNKKSTASINICAGDAFIDKENEPTIFFQEYGLRITLLSVQETYSSDGESEGTIYVFEIITGNRYKKVPVEDKNLQHLDWLIKASGGLLYLEAKEKENLIKTLISALRNADIRPTIKFDSGGWKKIENKFMYVLAHGVVGSANYPVIGDKKYSFPRYEGMTECEIFCWMWQMFSICKNPAVMCLLILYVPACFLSTLFSVAGAAIKFILCLIGETNSRKTSLALLMAKIFDSEENQPDVTFTATPGGIEKAAYECNDCCMILDDMKPGTTKAKNKEMGEKLELTTRIYGDRTPKKRMTGYGSDTKVSVGGGCIVTGEYIDGVESSRTRRVDIFIDRNEVDNAWLAVFQDRNYWSTYLYNLIAYVTRYSLQVIGEIKKEFAILRKRNKFQIDRRNDQYAQLCISANLMLDYGVSCHAISKETRQQLYEQIENWICQILEENEKETKAVSPLSIMVKSFFDYAQGHAEPINFFAKDSDKIYQNEECFFVSITKLRAVAMHCAEDIGASILFPGERELPKLLEQEKLILIKKEGEKTRRTLHLPGLTTGSRFLWIFKARLDEWIQRIEAENYGR